MHFRTYLLLPATTASTSLRARHVAAKYLENEGFAFSGRFGGRGDYFSIGGRYSGSLTFLRLKHANEKRFRSFWREFADLKVEQDDISVFRRHFPRFRRDLPVGRRRVGFYGRNDDAQLVDRTLFAQLRRGFANDVDYSWEIACPNVISTIHDDDNPWPTRIEAIGNYWVVVVDYHD